MPPIRSNPLIKERNAEPIPGYRLIEPLGKGGFGEVWKCEAPGGLHKAIKFVHGSDGELLGNELNVAEQELHALQHVKAIRHPFLLSIDRVEHAGGELLIVMELADRSLHDLLVECKAAGHEGIARLDLLMYLREVAEVLDLMNQQHGLAHLDIKPRNLFLVHQHVKVADFGLVNSLVEFVGQDQARFQLGAITPLYAAPETFVNKVTPFSDQYSLAIVYCELLTGQLPFNGKNFRRLAIQHTAGKPDLDRLPESDRPLVLTALAKDPEQRYGSCLEFILALIATPVSAPPSHSADTRNNQSPVSTATLHDMVVVEQQRAACIPRPTKSRTRSSSIPTVELTAGGAATLDGFHFLDCLGRSPLGEMWTVETPEGQRRLVKLVNTFSQGKGEETMREATVAAQLRAMKHRSLLPACVIPLTANRLAVITATLRDSLATRLQEAQSRSQAGIPRLELLSYLLVAARVLDELQALYGVQHLGLSPRNLMLVGGDLQIADFGLMSLVWMPAGQQAAQINPRYSAPELFARRFSPFCDQYSLALIYYELLTGDQVHGTRTPAQLAKVRSAGTETFDLLPAPDRSVVGKALHPEPGKRFTSCTDFIRALLQITPGGEEVLDQDGFSGAEEHRDGGFGDDLIPESRQPARFEPSPQAGCVIADLVKHLSGQRELREHRGVPYFYLKGEEIEHRAYARLVPGTLRLKLANFVDQWRVQLLEEKTDRFLFQLRLQTNIWRRMLGTPPALDLDIRAAAPTVAGASMTEVVLVIRAAGCGADEAGQALLKWGPPLIDSLRTALQVEPERRKQPRIPFERAITARPLLAAGRLGEEIQAQARDLSLEGLGVLMPVKPPTQLIVQLQRTGEEQPLHIPAQVVRTEPVGDGHYQIGLRFLLRE